MNVAGCFESGMVPPFEVADNTVTFDIRRRRVLNALVRQAPDPLQVDLLVDDTAAEFITGQGLLVAAGEEELLRAVPVEQREPGVLSAQIAGGGDLRVAALYPYGRDALDRLICDTHRTPHLNLRLLRRQQRTVPVFEFGDDGDGTWVHYFIAGEDAWETAGCWAADALVRTLCDEPELAQKLLAESVVRVVPLISPYSATQPCSSYTTLDGKGIYGAATWADPEPPPEYALIRDEVVEAIRARRLGFMMTMHSWQASRPHSGVETIRSAGPNRLSDARNEWASRTMETMFRDVPRAQVRIAEKIWHAGLARDYLLREHNAITFRIEVTTHNQGYDGFRETGRQIVRALAGMKDWGPVCTPSAG